MKKKRFLFEAAAAGSNSRLFFVELKKIFKKLKLKIVWRNDFDTISGIEPQNVRIRHVD